MSADDNRRQLAVDRLTMARIKLDTVTHGSGTSTTALMAGLEMLTAIVDTLTDTLKARWPDFDAARIEERIVEEIERRAVTLEQRRALIVARMETRQ